MYNINGVELEFDIFDAELARKFEYEVKVVRDAAAEFSKTATHENLGDLIEQQCNIIFRFFDALCGEGTHKRIFGDSVHLKDCTRAFVEFCAAVGEEAGTVKDWLK